MTSKQVLPDKLGGLAKGVILESTSISADQQQIQLYTRKQPQTVHIHVYNIPACFPPPPSISATEAPPGPYPSSRGVMA